MCYRMNYEVLMFVVYALYSSSTGVGCWAPSVICFIVCYIEAVDCIVSGVDSEFTVCSPLFKRS